MAFLKIYKERRDIPEINAFTEIRSHQIKKKYFILLIYGCCLICLLQYGSQSMSSKPPLIQSFSATRNHIKGPKELEH
jgi:hypothetical protein